LSIVQKIWTVALEYSNREGTIAERVAEKNGLIGTNAQRGEGHEECGWLGSTSAYCSCCSSVFQDEDLHTVSRKYPPASNAREEAKEADANSRHPL
jgi:hypothetical protein